MGFFLRHFRVEVIYMVKMVGSCLHVYISACNPRAKADIYFMIDASGSVRRRNFHFLLRFTNTLINSLAIGRNAIRVGVYRFDHRTTLMFNLNRYRTKAALTNAVNRIRYTNGGTYTSTVLQHMRRM
jgi:hypothetical protein